MSARQPPVERALFVVVGGDDGLTLSVCDEIARLPVNTLRVVWAESERLAASVRRVGAEFIDGDVEEEETLRRAGVEQADALLALSQDDRLNLHVALKARDVNPRIRLVLRIFNRALGRKIQQNLSNCSVVSPAAHSAATYATAAIDTHAFYGLPFPDDGGSLIGFSQTTAEQAGIAGISVAEAAHALKIRVVTVDGRRVVDSDEPLAADASIVLVAPVRAHSASSGEVDAPSPLTRVRQLLARVGRAYRQIDPIGKGIILGALSLFVLATLVEIMVVGLDPLTAVYFVVQTMTTTGFGDVPPHEHGPVAEIIAMFLMVCGLIFSGIFIATVSSSLTRARWESLQGMRPIYRRDHLIVCGAGQVGSRVIEYLRGLGHPIVVVERHPSPEIIELSRNRTIDLITADATQESVLDLCNLEAAAALVALTENDTMNLEVALSARARNPRLRIVMRIGDIWFGRSIARNFGIATTFSASELAAPTFSGYARTPNFLGRVRFGEVAYGLTEFREPDRPGVIRGFASSPLFVARDRMLVPVFRYDDVRHGDHVLALVPMSQFRDSVLLESDEER